MCQLGVKLGTKTNLVELRPNQIFLVENLARRSHGLDVAAFAVGQLVPIETRLVLGRKGFVHLEPDGLVLGLHGTRFEEAGHSGINSSDLFEASLSHLENLFTQEQILAQEAKNKFRRDSKEQKTEKWNVNKQSFECCGLNLKHQRYQGSFTTTSQGLP